MEAAAVHGDPVASAKVDAAKTRKERAEAQLQLAS